MHPEPVGRAVRVGGVSVEPGESRTVSLVLPGRAARPGPAARPAGRPDGEVVGPKPRAKSASARPGGSRIPAHVTVGLRAGPRLTILAAPRGFEAAAAAAATAFSVDIAAAQLEGSVVVIPVLRPGGRFAAGGRPIKEAELWQFPGDVGGSRRQREAFTIFSETCVGAQVVVLLTAPKPGRVSVPMVRGNVDDPRFRRLSLHAGLPLVVHARATPGTLGAAALDAGNTLIELVAPQCEATAESIAVLLGALRRLGELVGLIPAATFARPLPEGRASAAVAAAARPARRPASFARLIALGAGAGGLTEVLAGPGQAVKRDEVLAEVTPAMSRTPVRIVAPRDAVVIEAPDARAGRLGIRRGATLFRLVGGGKAARARLVRLAGGSIGGGVHPGGGGTARPSRTPLPLAEPTTRIGWVERVSLPLLGIDRLKAKIDTGARTSALHVSRMRSVGTAGPHRRPILEITIPHVGRNGRQTLVVRAPVREHVQVKDTSGRSERRPVIETAIRLGSNERRIRVTLTDRGDMLFPMLIGRTALGPGIVVDPARRYLLPVQPQPAGLRGGQPLAATAPKKKKKKARRRAEGEPGPGQGDAASDIIPEAPETSRGGSA